MMSYQLSVASCQSQHDETGENGKLHICRIWALNVFLWIMRADFAGTSRCKAVQSAYGDFRGWRDPHLCIAAGVGGFLTTESTEWTERMLWVQKLGLMPADNWKLATFN